MLKVLLSKVDCRESQIFSSDIKSSVLTKLVHRKKVFLNIIKKDFTLQVSTSKQETKENLAEECWSTY